MQMCERHWSMLRDKIREEGLRDWVATDGETAVAQLADQIARGESTRVNFDPLMAAHNMIMSNALQSVGLTLFTVDEHGNEYCPLCLLNSRRTEDGQCACTDPNCQAKYPGAIENFDNWVSHAVVGAKQYMIEQGWIET